MDLTEPTKEAPPAGDVPGVPDVPAEPSLWRPVLTMVYEQAWGLCVAYLAVGLIAEVGRRLGAAWASSALDFLDSLPFYAIRASGLLELYLRASAIGDLPPFWNRMLLSGITVLAILVQATLLGALLAAGWMLASRRRKPS
ncbi:MAG TPA: hypothetical protein VGK67_16865 [Myxococcales bacterium]|jgi:hypothetical protein